MTTQFVSSGVVSSGVIVASGDTLEIEAGGTADVTSVTSGGIQQVDLGGLASGTLISAGGSDTVFGSDSAAIVDGTLTVSSGGTTTGSTISSGGVENVLSSAHVGSSFISSGGIENVSAGGTAGRAMVDSGGVLNVFGLTNSAILESGGTQNVFASATISLTVFSGGTQNVLSGAIVSGAVIVNGAQNVSSGGTTSATKISSGATEFVSANGTATNTTVSSGGRIVLFGGATANGLTVNSGGTEEAGAGYTVGAIVFGGGATLVVDAGAFEIGTVISGATDIVSAGGNTSNTTISSGGVEFESGKGRGLTIFNGGIENVLAGGRVGSSVISSGGTENVSAGGTVGKPTVGSGGIQNVWGNTNRATVNGGTQNIFAGASTTATIVNGGTQGHAGRIVEIGTVVNGGTQTVSAGGTASGTTISNGTLFVLNSGTVSGVNISSSGVANVSGGGTVDVLSDNSVFGVEVGGGGTVNVFGGGTLLGNVANDGTLNYDITGSATFSGTLTGAGTLAVSGGGALKVLSAYTGAAQIDDASTYLKFASTYVGVASFSGLLPPVPAARLKLDVPSTGPINVVNPSDTVIAQPGSDSWINAIVGYTLPANIDTLFLYAGAQGAGNSDAAGDALYALDAGNTQTLTGNSPNDTFVVYNSSDVVVPKAASHDVVYAAASFTLPTGVDALFLEGTATQGVGNSDAAGDALYAPNPSTGGDPDRQQPQRHLRGLQLIRRGEAEGRQPRRRVLGCQLHAAHGGRCADSWKPARKASATATLRAMRSMRRRCRVATLTGNSANDTFVVYNAADVVVPRAGSRDTVYSAVNYTLPTGVDSLILEAGTQAVGNSDAAGDTLYAANAGNAQTLTGHSHNDTFVVYNSADTVIGQESSTDTVYAAASFTLPTNVDTLFLEGTASQGTGNGDANNVLFGNAGVASTLVAGSGADLLAVAGTAGTIMTGGAGADAFAFPNVMGKDEVTNFGIAKDMLQFNMTLFSNFTAAMNAAGQVGANTVFAIDANDTVTLDNVTKTSLTSSKFHLV